jgi:DNA-binding NarL/FixJ family response regulator
MWLENQPHIKIIGEASTGLQALKMAKLLNPMSVVMDITLPDISVSAHAVKLSHPDMPVVALTIHEDEQYLSYRPALLDMFQAVLRINKCYRAVHAGEVYIYPTLAKLLVADFISRAVKEKTKPVNGSPAETSAGCSRRSFNDEIANWHQWHAVAARECNAEVESAQPQRTGQIRHTEGVDYCVE